jgi:gliding motility-associated-like protein
MAKLKYCILYGMIFIINYQVIFSQNLFHQDIFYGGVTSGGFSTGLGSGSGILNLHIEPGSTIRNAFLFTYRQGYPPSVPIIVNNISYYPDTNICLMTAIHQESQLANPIKLYYSDIKSELSANPTSIFNITIPNQNGIHDGWGWFGAYIYIEYENQNLSKVASSIWINDEDYDGFANYLMSGMNKVNTSKPVGLSLMLDRACNATNDATIVNLNNHILGAIGFPDNVNWNCPCSGSKGHFYYQNDTLNALDDDSADALMSGSDALADISPYLNNDATGYHLILEEPASSTPNSNFLFLNAYSSPCDTFSTFISKDTTICLGQSVELLAFGGTNYKWEPQESLSNPNIFNPIATPQCTTLYSVKIEKSPGCSRTEKIKITVNQAPIINDVNIEPSICGEKTGEITVAVVGLAPLSYSIDGVSQNSATFSNLEATNYLISVKDKNGCVSDSTVIVSKVIQVEALFSASTQKGAKPLEVEFTNLSSAASNYSWYLDSIFLTNTTDYQHLFDTTGTFLLSLISWNNLQQCADTFSLQIIVFDSLAIEIPNVFTPNGDGVNDVFLIKILGAKDLHVQIFNRWGSLIKDHSYQLNEDIATINIWDGTNDGLDFSEGVYFYNIVVNDTNNIKSNYSGNFQLEK